MKSKIEITALLILFVCSSCNAQKVANKSHKIPNGKWVCVQDSLNSVVVIREYVYEYYNSQPTDTTKYSISTNPCDTLYKSPKKKTLFLTWHNGLCYEVEGITDEYIELTYTANGKTLTYRKQ